jgi:hypothetical protein
MGTKRVGSGGWMARVLVVLLPLILVGAAMGQVVTPTVSLMGPSEIGIGTPFAVEVQVEDARGVAGWEGDVTWNPEQLELVDVQEGPYIAIPYAPALLLEATPGAVSVGQWSVKSRSGTLAEFTFTGLTDGVAAIDLTDVVLTDIEARVYPTPEVWGMTLYVGPTVTPTPTVTNTPTITPTPTSTSTPTPVCRCIYWDGRETACTED